MKRIEKLVFMSWLNEGPDKKPVRAYALCDSTGWFEIAINCFRGSSRYDKDEIDEDGIYKGGTWLSDPIIDHNASVRPATREEITVYLKHAPLELAVDTFRYAIDYVVEGYDRTEVIVHERLSYRLNKWWLNFKHKIRRR